MAGEGDDNKKRAWTKVGGGGGGGGGKKENGANKKQKSKKKPAPIAVAPDGGEVYEAETVVGARMKRNGDWEYRVRWKGYSSKHDTWEPLTNLYGPLHSFALRLRKEKSMKEAPLGIKEAEAQELNNNDYNDIFNEELDQESYLAAANVEKKRVNAIAQEKKSDLAPDLWEWNDKEQVKFRDIERIDVHDEDAARRVTEARENGVPVCLVGHTGWANFARRWLKRKGGKTHSNKLAVAHEARSEWRDQEDDEVIVPGPDMAWAHRNGKSNKGCKVLCVDEVKKPFPHNDDDDDDGKMEGTTTNLNPTTIPISDGKSNATVKPPSAGEEDIAVLAQNKGGKDNATPDGEDEARNSGKSNEGSNGKTLVVPPQGCDDPAVTENNSTNNNSSAQPTKVGDVSSGGIIKGEGIRLPEVSDASSFEMSPSQGGPTNQPKAIAADGSSTAAAEDKPSVTEATVELDAQLSGPCNNEPTAATASSMEPDFQIGKALEASSQVLGVKATAKEDATYNISRASQAVEPQDVDKQDSTISQECNAASSLEVTMSDGWLDLTEEWEVDVEKMIEDLGTEMVPVLRPHYNEQKPINGQVPLAEFLKRCWPSEGSAKTPQRLYLHQWQFPLSPQAAEKLCGPGCHNPLPHDILGEDLLKWWQDSNNNPYQYIFMGRDETLSKLHRDAGGLAISIAPVVGEKEVVLVHRADGYSCLSHLQASLEKIDLNKYPLVSQARIYKSVIKPGEILLMPQGTFHQCRNITPCLSYSKFYLDTVNLRAFLESCMNGDAPEISHEEILWNCSHELSKQVDQYTDKVKTMRKNCSTEVSVPPDIVRKVDALRALRCISRAIYLRYERGDRMAAGEGDGEMLTTCEEEAKRWADLLRDTDVTLHDFRYRNRSSKPSMRPQCPGTSFMKTDLEKDLESCPKVANSGSCQQADNLAVGSKVEVKWNERIVEGEVLRIESAMQAAFCHFEALPDVYDEYLRFESLRVPVSGEVCVDMLPEDVKPGKIIVYPYGTEEYRAVIKDCVEDTFLKLRLTAGPGAYTRWLPRKAILQCKA